SVKSCSGNSRLASSTLSSLTSATAAAPPTMRPGARSSNISRPPPRSDLRRPRRKPSTSPIFIISGSRSIPAPSSKASRTASWPRIRSSRSILTWMCRATERGDTDRDGNEIEDRIYNTKDFDRNIVIDDRTKLVAKKVSDFLKESKDRFQKTIIFCVDEEHAARMRQALINENKDLCNENHRYVMRITGSDAEGQAQLGNFIDPEATYPVLITTSRLLSTGVD